MSTTHASTTTRIQGISSQHANDHAVWTVLYQDRTTGKLELVTIDSDRGGSPARFLEEVDPDLDFDNDAIVECVRL